MQAPRVETQILPPPPGIFGSIRTGFDTIAAHVTVILVPLAFDVLLWLGPRISTDRIGEPFLRQFGTWAASAGVKPDDIQNTLDMSSKFLQAFNLLGFLRTFPIGIFSLMTGVMPTQTPLGAPTVLQVESFLQLLALAFLLTVLGWMLGGLYFRWVAALSIPDGAPEVRPSVGRAVVQTVLYALIWTLFFWVVGLPVMLLLNLLFMINAVLGEGVLLLLGFVSIWLVVPLFFSPHGIFTRRQNALNSILSGFQMTRFTLPTSSLFVLTVFLLGAGLNIFLWSKAADDSWFVLVGIFGHAFITTALLASSFVYYHNMSAWLQVALARLRAGLPGQQA